MSIHLIVGESGRLAKKEIENIFSKNKYIYFNMKHNTFLDFFEECSYNFFLDETKYIVVKNIFDNLKEQEEVSLLKYFSNPSQKINIIFLEEKIDSRKKIIKELKKNFIFIDNVINYKNVYPLVNDYIKYNGFSSDYETSKYLVGIFALNVDLIFNELDKVFLYYGKPESLTVGKIENIISTPLNTSNFKFVDAVINKNLNHAKNILEDLYKIKTEPTSLIILLAREYRLISYVKTYMHKNMNVREISSKLKLQDWQIDKYYKISLTYTDNEIKEILCMLAEYDKKIKTGELEKNSAIQLIILNIIV